MDATETILLEKGVEGFTLREAARRAGVSPAAPAHHFGSARGLLSAVAREGFAEFGRMLAEADAAAGPDPQARLMAQGAAYVRFALSNRAWFLLMFRSDIYDPEWEDLAAVSTASFRTLQGAVRDLMEVRGAFTLEAFAVLAANWSLVHGFAHLALEHSFDSMAKAIGGEHAVLEKLLPAMLRATIPNIAGK